MDVLASNNTWSHGVSCSTAASLDRLGRAGEMEGGSAAAIGGGERAPRGIAGHAYRRTYGSAYMQSARRLCPAVPLPSHQASSEKSSMAG